MIWVVIAAIVLLALALPGAIMGDVKQDDPMGPAPQPQANQFEKFVQAVMLGIAKAEGFFSPNPNVIPRKNHNPGDFMDPEGKLFPQYPKDRRGYVIFPDDAAGWQALRKEVITKITGQSRTSFRPQQGADSLADIYASTSPEVERRAWAKTVIREINAQFNTNYGTSTGFDLMMKGVNAT